VAVAGNRDRLLPQVSGWRMTKLLTVPEVATLLRVSIRHVRLLIGSGHIPVVHLGRRTLVDPASLERSIRDHETPRPAA
jgi:excisionase family DNA binding protein